MKLIAWISLLGIFYKAPLQTVRSPDQQTVFEMRVQNGALEYKVGFGKATAIDWSAMGLANDAVQWGSHTSIDSSSTQTQNSSFAWPLGERDRIDNHYNELHLYCHSGQAAFILTVRVFDGAVAFRYELPASPAATTVLKSERTQFNLSSAAVIYQYNQESVFTETSIDTFFRTCDLPATIRKGNLYMSIGEANNTGYTKAELKKAGTGTSLMLSFPRDTALLFTGKIETPWRTISLSTTAIGLHQFSDLYLKLVPAPATVPGWIVPGKLIRAQLSTQSGMECIDFAAAHGFRYIMFDAGWYGAEFRTTSDPTQTIAAIDMHKLVQHGNEKNIGIILYVNYVGLRSSLDTILPLYKSWGIKGLKFGFVDGLTQKGLQWLSAAIRKVNDAGFILDIHDNYKPTGLSHAFPALLTQEGIRGDENSPDAFHTTVLPFTRFLAGPADFTFCFPNPSNSFSKNLKVSKAQQLALTVINFSPLQSIFWYGKPLDYTNESEIEFFTRVPTVWNESHYLSGEIGQHISVARRSGNEWFVGMAAGMQHWTGNLRCDFLEAGKLYSAVQYADDGQGGLLKKTLSVKKGMVLPVTIQASGGLAMVISPITK